MLVNHIIVENHCVLRVDLATGLLTILEIVSRNLRVFTHIVSFSLIII
jgi:hypothetical protein